MKRNLLPFAIISVFLYLGIEPTFSQTVELRVVFPSNIDSDRLSISYDNGKECKNIKPVIVNHEWILKDSLYDPYAGVFFYYTINPKTRDVEGHGFWISNKPAEIIFHGDSMPGNRFLERYTLRNVLSQNEISKNMPDSGIGQAWAELDDYYRRNFDSIRTRSSQADTFDCKRNAVVKKELERIRTQPKDYFVLDHFRSSVVSMRSAFTSNELLAFFNDNFPDSLKNIYKGKQIAKVLKDRINSKKGGEAPDFKAKSINGDEVSLRGLRGKYIILDFWASWCAPCIKTAAPKLKEIRQKYSRDKLEIVSVTLDENYDQYHKALKKLDTGFIDIFNGKQVVKDYAVGPIPQIILIHPDGTILYNREEENDADLAKLGNMLEHILQLK